MNKIKDRIKDDRPREKLKRYGAGKLSDLELLMAIIGSGNAQADVTEIARDVLKLLKQYGGDTPYQSLSAVGGIGQAKAAEIIAAFELAGRYLVDPEQPVIDSLEAVAAQLIDIRNKKQEYFVCLTLDGANRLIAKRIIAIGTLTASLVHPREVFADAITDRAASIIVAHNHPSGDTTPSRADIELTKRLEESAQLLGIRLVDHVIITKNSFITVAQEN